MDELEAIQKLATKAKNEITPDFDIAARVIARANFQSGAISEIRSMKFLATVSAIAAAMILALALYLYVDSDYPIADLFPRVEVVYYEY